MSSINTVSDLSFYGGLLGPQLIERFALNCELVEEYRDKPTPFGFNGLGEVVYLRTYAREKDNGECEVWVDTIERVVNGVFEILHHYIVNKLHCQWDTEKAKRLSEDMFKRIFDMKFLPPGRGLWAMGSPIITKKGFAAALNNCAFVSTSDLQYDRIYPFTFLMDASMLGVGVGFDTIGAGTFSVTGPNNNLPVINFVVPDDREGWVESVKLLLNAYFNNSNDVNFDYSKIRELGTKLKTFGGSSSGPGPLITLHRNIRKVLDSEIDKPISVTCITDIMNMIGVCTVSGNIRRCLPRGSLVHTKDGLIDIEKIKVGDIVQTFNGYEKVTNVFEQGFQHLVRIKTDHGEFVCTPNHQMAILKKDTEYEWIKAKDLRTTDLLLTTRVPILGKYTELPSSDNLNIPELDANMAWFIGIFTKYGFIYYEDNYTNMYIYITIDTYGLADNVRTQIKRFSDDLNVTIEPMYTNKYLVKCISNELSHYFNQYITINNIPDFITQSTLNIKISYINGIMIENKINNKLYHITSSESKIQILKLQTLCYSCGFETRIEEYKYYYNLMIVNEHGTNVLNYIDDSDKIQFTYYPVNVISVTELFNIEETFDIEVENRHEFYCNGYLTHNSAEISFGQADCKEFLNLKNYEVNPQRQEHGWASNNSIFANIGMDYTEVCEHVRHNGEPGFCWLENMKTYSRINGPPDNKDIRVSGGNPCLEQSLESMELCCLVETFPNKHESLEDFKETLKSAFLFAKTVTLLPLHWHKSNEIMMRNRRIGCSVSGIAQFITDRGLNELKQWLEEGYDTLKDIDKEISEWLCIRQSIKMTSVKPSGTVSLLAGATPGMHYPESQYYIRRIRIARDSYLLKILSKAGYHIEPCCMVPETTVVVEFPVCAGSNIRTTRDVTMWEQLSLAAFMQKYWADNQVSATITFDPETEGKNIANALTYFQYQLKGISFLPRLSDNTIYKQVPYEAITKEQYNNMYSKINKNISLSTGAIAIATDEANMTYCDGDRCIRL